MFQWGKEGLCFSLEMCIIQTYLISKHVFLHEQFGKYSLREIKYTLPGVAWEMALNYI